ncbi:permease [Acanthopleuribacter pedis]|uniref:Permease n=1 Tax=Acanthopleuribacter pedis TaxID=442870 RepID=A0A8J7QMW4_9BACT|nr:permease [Acanthopleuribacter pedis]MBO1320935.1 permease [Acanthopleuribacter pedis]
MTLLIAGIATLFLGPILYGLLSQRKSWLSLLDGFIFISIAGLVLAVILPETLADGGWWSLLFLFVGLMLPSLSERLFHGHTRETHLIALALGFLGLAIHAVTDGAILALPEDHHHGGGHDHGVSAWSMALGVLLHRFPIGLTIWWFVRPKQGLAWALAALGLIAVGTLIGFFAAPQVVAALSTQGMAWFQAFVAGSLLHVVFHQPHGEESCCPTAQRRNLWFEGFGNLAGLALLVYMVTHHITEETNPWLVQMSTTFVDLARESAPALLIAYVLAGIIAGFMPDSYINWLKGGSRVGQSMRGMMVGLPLPICSCGVVPLYHTLIRKGAPPTAAMAFLIATPELGLDALLLSLPLLGAEMTLARLIAAALVALLVGVAVGSLAQNKQVQEEKKSCCSGNKTKPSFSEKMRKGLREGLVDLVDNTGPWILIGLTIAAVADPLMSTGMLRSIPTWAEIPLFALLGMPIYVCAAGATPLIAVFLLNGVSPGAALAFLLTGPATNITTFGVLSELHGRRTALLFGLFTLGFTLIAAYSANLLLPNFTATAGGHEHAHWTWYQIAAFPCLLALYLYSFVRRGARNFFAGLVAEFNFIGRKHAH